MDQLHQDIDHSLLAVSEEGDQHDHESWDGDIDFEHAMSGVGDDDVHSRPIVVGYSFGPKKMSTMGVVMAEASQTRLLRNQNTCYQDMDDEDDEEQMNERDGVASLLATDPFRAPMERHTTGDSDLAVEEEDRTHQYQPRSILAKSNKSKGTSGAQKTFPQQQQPTTVIFSVDGYGDGVLSSPTAGLRNIVRTLAGPSSAGDDSSAHSTGTRTASTATTLASLRNGSFPSSTTQDTPMRAPNTANATPIRVSFVPLDPEIPLEEQHGGIDIILHKLTEDILLLSQLSLQHEDLKTVLQRDDAEKILSDLPLSQKDMAAIRRVHRLCQFQKQHGCYLVDDPVCVQKLMSRADIAHVLNQCLSSVSTSKGMTVRSPKYAVVMDSNVGNDDSCAETNTAQAIIGAVNEAQLNFPIIVKPLTAAGTKASHAMAVVTNPSGLEQITDRVPCLLQEYVNHNAFLFKVYVLGDFVSVHKRRSLPNLPLGPAPTSNNGVVQFDSQRPYPRLRDFGYIAESNHLAGPGTPSEGKQQSTADAMAGPQPKSHIVTAEEVGPIVNALKSAFGLEIFGFDILITSGDASEQSMLVVDVNYFPSYKEVPNFPALLAEYLTRKAIARRVEVSDAKKSDDCHKGDQ
eukprot:CAMPEP_0172454482 /NCGR_PEP_ID=MMETSP1065-20121228/11458_1 /TAXON_ID=265537 /ORGANISM="Amphiprora paludosa, Strain CCMP125" /LENGTH=629 /DNA_ID=CAMNT_0013206821 /DNA_START=336 /DNA_END=2225 /DNA_ORIENTATION=-